MPVQDADGYQYVSVLRLAVGPQAIPGQPGTCELLYHTHWDIMQLNSNDNNSPYYLAATTGLVGTGHPSLGNTQCTLDPTHSSFTGSGTGLTMSLALTFPPAYIASGQAINAATIPGLDHFVQEGSWAANAPGSTVPVTVGASVSGLSFTVDGVTYTTSHTFNWTPQSPHQISTPSPQAGAPGTQYAFANWTGGGAQSQNITATAGVNYTANFTPQYYLTTAASQGGSISPASGWYNGGTSVPVTATPSTGYGFAGFSGGIISGITNPQTVPPMTTAGAVTANFSVALSVVTTSLPTATQGTPYSASLTATGGSGPYSWFIANLPQGLSLTSATGIISGTPAAVGTFTTLPVIVTDSNSTRVSGNLASPSVPFKINQGTGGGAGLNASCVASPSSAQVGQVVSFSATATGTTGTPNFSWTGIVSGLGSTVSFTPSSSGSLGETVTVTDSVSTRTASCSVAVQGSTSVPLTISTSSPLPYAFGGLSYATTFGATGGSGGYSWKLLGTLPAGLSLSTSGALTGASASGGNYAFRIEVDDSSGHAAYGQFALTVAAPQGQIAVQLASPQLGSSAGLAHQYLFHIADAAGASDITGGQIVINASLSSPAATPGCQLDWNSSGGLNITGVAFGSFGGTATLQGSACTLYTGSSTLTRVASGYDVSLSVAISSPLPSGILLPVWARGVSASSGTPPYSNIGAWSITLPSSGSSYSALAIDPGDFLSQPFCGTGVWGFRIGGFTPNRYKDGSIAESAAARMTGSFVPGFTNTASNGRLYSPTFDLVLANSGEADSFDSDLAILLESDPASPNPYSQPNQPTGKFTHYADYQFYNPNCTVPDFDYGFATGSGNVIYVPEFWEEFSVVNATSDPTPQIDSISLDQPLVSGGSSTLTIIGSNFGN